MIVSQHQRITIDLGKVQWMQHGYVNQHGQKVPTIPKVPTVHGCKFNTDALHIERQCTMLEYATSKELLDIWTPYVKLVFASNHCLVITGQRAVSIKQEFNRRQYKKKK